MLHQCHSQREIKPLLLLEDTHGALERHVPQCFFSSPKFALPNATTTYNTLQHDVPVRQAGPLCLDIAKDLDLASAVERAQEGELLLGVLYMSSRWLRAVPSRSDAARALALLLTQQKLAHLHPSARLQCLILCHMSDLNDCLVAGTEMGP